MLDKQIEEKKMTIRLYATRTSERFQTYRNCTVFA